MPDRVRLMLVSDRRRLPGGDLAALAGEAARAGVDDVQLREKDLGGRALAALARDVAAALAGTGARLLVNGRADVAAATGASGVQLPEEGLPVAAVKAAFPALLIGASRHSADGVRQAEDDGADLVILGPVFGTPGQEDRALGLQAIASAARHTRLPVYAIGGIEPANARAVAEAGAGGLALLRPFLAGRVADTVLSLREALA